MLYQNNESVNPTCERCGAVLSDADGYEVRTNADVELWCEGCVSSHAVECDHCGELYDEDSLTEVQSYSHYRMETEMWCPICVQTDACYCEDCDELVDMDAANNLYMCDGSNRVVCDTCLENYYRCESCGDYVHDSDAHFDCGHVYCEYCYTERYNDEYLQEYGETDGEYFWRADGYCSRIAGNTLFLGAELETDHNDSAYELARDLIESVGNDRICCKRDSSLGPNGVEIVTQPMELLYHLDHGINLWGDIVRIVRDHDGHSYDSGKCGLHVHLSRAALTDGCDYRIDRLFHRFWAEFIRFSRRQSDNPMYAKLDATARTRDAWKDIKHGGRRYVAVNVKPVYTVELRLWRGSLNLETIYATLEFSAGIALVCNAYSDADVEAVTWDGLKADVIAALESIGARTCELVAYFKRREL